MKNWQEIDLATWPRSTHCAVFQRSVQPMYSVTFELDISRFLKKVRKRRLSFTLSFIFVVAKCANGIEEFRYRFLDGRPILYDRIHTVFTWLDEGSELFKVVQVEIADTLEAYAALASRRIKEQKEYFTGPPGNDTFVFSELPWISFTHVSHTDSGKKDNAIPMFDWGRYTRRGKKTFLPFSVQVHHSFVDGVHVGKLAQRLQGCLDKFPDFVCP